MLNDDSDNMGTFGRRAFLIAGVAVGCRGDSMTRAWSQDRVGEGSDPDGR